MKPGLCNFAVAFAIVGFTSVALGYQVYGAIGEKWNSLGGAADSVARIGASQCHW